MVSVNHGKCIPGTGMRVPTNGRIAWNLHYFPVGAEGPGDVVEVGLWFYLKTSSRNWKRSGSDV